MSSFCRLSQSSTQQFESPAKIFARLKSKVQREERVGVFTRKEPLGNRDGGHFESPRRRNAWQADALKENRGFESQALILSPIASPKKPRGLPDISHWSEEDTAPVCTPRKRGYLESTAVCHPLSLANRNRIHTDPPHMGDLDGFRKSSRTPVKVQQVEEDCVFEEKCAALDRLMSPVFKFSPMRNRLRKRKLQDFEVSSSGGEVPVEPQQMKTSSGFSGDDTHNNNNNNNNNTPVEDLGDVRQSGMNERSMLPPSSIALQRSCVVLEKMPPMSPAKMFAYMKDRERKRDQQDVQKVTSNMRDHLDEDPFQQSRVSPPPTAHAEGETESLTFDCLPQTAAPVSKSRGGSADSQSDTDPSEDFLVPAPPSHPVLFEDPLVLNSPRVSIPKKHMPIFKRNKWPQPSKFPSESVIHLRKWFLRKNDKGLFIDGIHREENIPWHSNLIKERVSKTALRSISGRVYILDGKMNLHIDSEFPKWLLKKFVDGFPINWKELYDKFLSGSRADSDKGREKSDNGRGVAAKAKSNASSANMSMKRQRQKTLKTPDSSSPPTLSSAKTSRSGRVIKPPLEYWKGGRVILDAHMNVTIHECYDTSICVPVTATVSARPSQQRDSLQRRKGRSSLSSEEESAPIRRVKAPTRKVKKNIVSTEDDSTHSPEHLVKTPSSSDGSSGRQTRSKQRQTQKMLKKSTQRPQKQTQDNTRPPVRVSNRKRTVSTYSSCQSSDEETVRRKRQKEAGHMTRGRKEPNKTRPSYVFPSSPSSESSKDSRKKVKTTTRQPKNSNSAQTQKENKRNNCTVMPPPAKPLPKSTPHNTKQKGKKGRKVASQEQDEDEWTEAELQKLQQIVSMYPKQKVGYWDKVARMVGSHTAEECHKQYNSQGPSQTPAKKPQKSKKQKKETTKDAEQPVISARVGTLKRKQQVRQFVEAMPREEVNDVFSSEFMQDKCFEMATMCPTDNFSFSNLEPVTPTSAGFSKVKTPQCLHITPGFRESPNRSNDDKYAFQLQKKMKNNQFKVCKQAPSSKSFTPTPSVKRAMRRCGTTENDTFVVWEMFPENDQNQSESGEEDFYFSDND